ncbi:MAG: type II toxin-antitoxin system HicA family toxin [Bacteroidales bacterium]|nr:type II toxin-antitoxin system HicA family toxin [Bacteroidales bacterium]
MSTKEKLMERFKTLPSDFSFDELSTLLCRLGYRKEEKGKTSGSRAIFTCDDATPLLIHKPHPGNIVQKYVMKRIMKQLTDDGKIKKWNENS